MANFITEAIEGYKEKKRRQKEMLQEARDIEMTRDRMKSPNERLLDRYMKEEKEAHIKELLEKYHKKHELLARSDVISQKNIFAGHKNILNNGGMKWL